MNIQDKFEEMPKEKSNEIMGKFLNALDGAIYNKYLIENKEKINYCQNCGEKIFDKDKLCTHCINKKKNWATVGIILGYILLYFLLAYATFYIFKTESYTFGTLFTFILLPFIVKKARKSIDKKYNIQQRRVLNGIPCTLNECVDILYTNEKLLLNMCDELNIKTSNEPEDSNQLKVIVKGKYYNTLPLARTNCIKDYPMYLYYFKSDKHFSSLQDVKIDFTVDVMNKKISSPKVQESVRRPSSAPIIHSASSTQNNKSDLSSKKTKNKSPVITRIMCALLSVTLIASMIGLVYQHNRIITQQEKIDTQQDQIEQLSRSVEVNREYYKEYYDDAMAYQSYKFRSVFINPNDKYYHKQSCIICNDDTCRFCDFILARQLGYEPCPYCS